jgi:hypothetical protein
VSGGWTGLLPYAVALVLGPLGVVSRLLGAGHRGAVYAQEIRFAQRWTAGANVIGLPVLSYAYMVTRIAQRIEKGTGPALSAGGVVIGAILSIAFILAAYRILTTNLWKENELPELRIRGHLILGFDPLVRVAQVVGIISPGVIDALLG